MRNIRIHCLPAGIFASVALALAAANLCVSAQPYPSKQIEFVVQTSPGSGTDVFGRGVTDMLLREKLITQTIVVNNRVGGSGAVAYGYIKSKRGDPYVVLCTATGGVLLNAARPELNLCLENYTFLSFLAQDPQVIAVHSDLKVKTIKELLDAGKREPNVLSMAMSSTLGVGRQLLYLMDKEAGAKFKLVVFKGGGEATTAVAGGHVSFTAENLSEMAGHVQAGKLRVIAVTGEKRMPALPDTPTLVELGYPSMVLGTGRGFSMPAAVPKEAAAAMEAILRKLHQTKAWKDFAARNMYEEKYLSSADFTDYMQKRLVEQREFLAAIGTVKNP
jgi:putative tricarboxylic transport membrane protein